MLLVWDCPPPKPPFGGPPPWSNTFQVTVWGEGELFWACRKSRVSYLYIPAKPIWDLDSSLFPGLAGWECSWESVSWEDRHRSFGFSGWRRKVGLLQSLEKRGTKREVKEWYLLLSVFSLTFWSSAFKGGLIVRQVETEVSRTEKPRICCFCPSVIPWQPSPWGMNDSCLAAWSGVGGKGLQVWVTEFNEMQSGRNPPLKTSTYYPATCVPQTSCSNCRNKHHSACSQWARVPRVFTWVWAELGISGRGIGWNCDRPEAIKPSYPSCAPFYKWSSEVHEWVQLGQTFF